MSESQGSDDVATGTDTTNANTTNANNNNNNKTKQKKKEDIESAAIAALEQLRIDGSSPTSTNDTQHNSTESSSSSSQQQHEQRGGVVAAQHLLGSGNANVADLLGGRYGSGGGSVNGNGEDRKRHAFWDTQPMIVPNEGSSDNSNINPTPNNPTTPNTNSQPPKLHAPIIPDKSPSAIRQTPYNMPKGFEWSSLDINSPTDRSQIYELLANNYVEDDDCLFRFDYSTDFLTWALTPPNYNPAFHLGVRSTKSNRLMALITGVPATVRAYERPIDMVEINFLCVHKKLRSKRLAPVLIKEITRRVNLSGVFQAVYTAGVVLPTPVATCRYFHRSLDPKKLVEIGFSRIPPRMTMARMQKLYRLPETTITGNPPSNETETDTPPTQTPSTALLPLTESDITSAHQLVTTHLQKFRLAIVFSPDEFRHWFLPRPGVISTYVAHNDPSDVDRVTDLVSFYHLPSTIIGNPKHSHLRAAYSFYNVATSVDLVTLMKDALVLAKYGEGMDVFNALRQMDNGDVLTELKFGIGDGNLNYYLYNWCCPTLKSEDVGIVLL